MIELSELKPLQREALLAMLKSNDGALHRTQDGFAPSTHGSLETFTKRTMLGLEREGLVVFTDAWLTTVKLTALSRRILAIAARDESRRQRDHRQLQELPA